MCLEKEDEEEEAASRQKKKFTIPFTIGSIDGAKIKIKFLVFKNKKK